MHPMQYRKPIEDEVKLMGEILQPLDDAYRLVEQKIPEGRHKQRALDDILDARMHANQAIIIHADDPQ